VSRVSTAAKSVGLRTKEIHAKIAALSSNSIQRTVPSTDMIHLDNPPAVVDAVSDVITAVRTKRRIAP
jgi:hypothetical protein